MNGELDVFEALGAPPLQPSDPLSGWASAQIPWEYSRHFPAEAFEPEPDWLTRAWAPVDYLWETGEQFVEQSLERAPELLWGYGLSKLRKVDEGAGVTVVHSQAPYAGGAPAPPIQKTTPFYTPMAGAPPQAVGTSMMILIGAGLIVLYILIR